MKDTDMSVLRSIAVVVLVLLAFVCHSFGQDANDSDSSMRAFTSQRIARDHGIQIDWQNYTLSQLVDAGARLDAVKRINEKHGIKFDWGKSSLVNLVGAESRLDVTKRIKEKHGLEFDWVKTPLPDLVDAESRLDTVKRIERNHEVKFDWQKSTLLALTDAEARLNAAKRIEQNSEKTLNWRDDSLSELRQIERNQSGRVQPGLPMPTRTPYAGSRAGFWIGASPGDSLEDIKSKADDLSYEIRKLRRNVQDYDSYEFSRKLRGFEGDLKDLSGKAGDLGAHSASSSLDDASWDIHKVRRDVENSKPYFYGERDDDIDRRLKRVEWDTESVSPQVDE